LPQWWECPKKNSIIGDFNIPDIDWEGGLQEELLEAAQDAVVGIDILKCNGALLSSDSLL
jgi:hypothetical protein